MSTTNEEQDFMVQIPAATVEFSREAKLSFFQRYQPIRLAFHLTPLLRPPFAYPAPPVRWWTPWQTACLSDVVSIPLTGCERIYKPLKLPARISEKSCQLIILGSDKRKELAAHHLSFNWRRPAFLSLPSRTFLLLRHCLETKRDLTHNVDLHARLGCLNILANDSDNYESSSFGVGTCSCPYNVHWTCGSQTHDFRASVCADRPHHSFADVWLYRELLNMTRETFTNGNHIPTRKAVLIQAQFSYQYPKVNHSLCIPTTSIAVSLHPAPAVGRPGANEQDPAAHSHSPSRRSVAPSRSASGCSSRSRGAVYSIEETVEEVEVAVLPEKLEQTLALRIWIEPLDTWVRVTDLKPTITQRLGTSSRTETTVQRTINALRPAHHSARHAGAAQGREYSPVDREDFRCTPEPAAQHALFNLARGIERLDQIHGSYDHESEGAATAIIQSYGYPEVAFHADQAILAGAKKLQEVAESRSSQQNQDVASRVKEWPAESRSGEESQEVVKARSNQQSQEVARIKTIRESTAAIICKDMVVETAGDTEAVPYADKATVVIVKNAATIPTHPDLSNSHAYVRAYQYGDEDTVRIRRNDEDGQPQRARQGTVQIPRNDEHEDLRAGQIPRSDDNSDGKVNQSVYASEKCRNLLVARTATAEDFRRS
ncbi:uncharacterized protein MYCFIDRAFT_180264 [Pseudocercospora fijiensis CIRAD86]|uniref:Uncharacterized protein n=1 Tax=Pseudocercospora fijiensis (strain CIRAD86) TaxID=383855 RepID=M3AHY0_PSEFD|nr:uncharacterized protein MYCFIDRAFT_180264 [Pseudocercospora fijiensis CIRAD86]EME77117.1 hypothetical protein MYCFIDRAFT_180264 [Pseudocercospora fijiensis CIRAD86]